MDKTDTLLIRQSIANLELQIKDPVRNGGVFIYLLLILDIQLITGPLLSRLSALRKFENIAQVHPYPWLRLPHAQSVRSFSAWRGKFK